MNERIAIVGASVRAAAAAAKRAGFTVAAADLFADEDLREISDATRIDRYPEGLADWLKSLSPRPAGWLYTGALENHPELVDQMAEHAPLWGNSGEVLRQVRSPWELAATLREAGLHFPEMRDTPSGLPRDGSWLVKTGRGASGSGVSILCDAAVDAAAFCQRRIVGTPCSAVYVAASGQSKLLGVVRQLVGERWLHAREFQYCGAIGPHPVSADVHSELCRIGDALAARFALRGLFGVDFILDNADPGGDRVWTIEVNPRYPASAEIVERAGVALFAEHVAACHDAIPPTKGVVTRRMHGKAILFSRDVVEIVSDLRRVSQEFATEDQWPALADIPSVGARIERAHPVLTLFATGGNGDEVIANLKARVAIVERQLYSQ